MQTLIVGIATLAALLGMAVAVVFAARVFRTVYRMLKRRREDAGDT